MDELALENLLYQRIPITQAMGIEVVEFKPTSVIMRARLKQNLNHMCTAFGGSINSLMTLCGWAAVLANLKESDVDAHIVIHKSSIEYLAPIKNDFVAEWKIDKRADMDKFLRTYEKFGRARIKLNVCCQDQNVVFSRFSGQYVVFR